MSSPQSNSERFDLDRGFTIAAQGLVLVSIFVTTWAIGGYYPVARLVSLGLLMAAVILLWMAPKSLLRSVAGYRNKILALIPIAMIGVGLLQIIPVPHATIWTGVDDLRRRLGDSDHLPIQPLTLATWETKTWLAMATIGVAGFLLSGILFRTKRSRLLLLAAIALCGAGQVFWAIIQMTRFPDQIFWGVSNPGGSRPFGTFLNRNHGADFVGMALACAVGLMWYHHHSSDGRKTAYGQTGIIQRLSSKPIIGLLWILIAWLLTGVAISLSRGAWISSAIALLAVPLFWSRKQNSRQTVLIPIALISVAMVGVGVQLLGFGDQIESRMDTLQVDEVLANARLDHWIEVLPAVEHFLPLGSGFGTYGYAYLPFDPKPANGWWTFAHNQYLETAMEAGITGVLLVLTGLFLAFRACRRLCHSERSASEQAMGIAAMIALLMQAIHAFTDFGLMMPANLLTLGLILGAASRESEESLDLQPGPGDQRKAAHTFSSIVMASLVTAVVAAALWHQMASVRSERILAATRFSTSTPAPTVNTTSEWIQQLQQELKTSPDNHHLQTRLTQLLIHRAQRLSFDEVMRGGVESLQTTDAVVAWNRTTLEAVIARLFADGRETLSADQRSRIQATMAAEPNLIEARASANRLLQHNPIQSRSHMRLAILDAVSGRDWSESFQRAVKLSVVDPQQSLGNGLLAWAAHDEPAMIDQWKQTLLTDPSQLNVIFSLVRSRLSDKDIVERLMPNRWTVPYRLAITLRKSPADTELRERLLEKAIQIVRATEADELAISSAQAVIATERGDHDQAAAMYAAAVKSSPKDPELRYRHAYSLLRAGQGREAAEAAQVALRLSPGSEKYTTLLNRARELHRRQAKSTE